VLSIAFSPENRQIISCGRDKKIKLWNALGECKFTIDDAHSEWVSCVKFCPDAKENSFVSCGWDNKIKIWDKNNMNLKTTMLGHSNYINCLAMSPNGLFVASGGKDGKLIVWNIRNNTPIRRAEFNTQINVILFSPKYYWIICGTDQGLKVNQFKFCLSVYFIY
jgi:guanine nucleotide-binding protein subunit beta-2-like 1 protein